MGSPLGALVKADAEKWWPIIKDSGIRTLEILGTAKTVPKGGPVGQTGTSNIGHLLGVDTNGSLYTAGELSTVFGKTQGPISTS